MEDTLKTLGLTDQEAKIYLACLKLGSSKASQIALHAGIERKASYYTLERLLNKGMITETIKSGVKYYSITPPQLLFHKVEEEKKTKEEAIRELIEKTKELEKIAIPKPIVEQYEGIQGYKTILRELTTKPKSTLYGYISERVGVFMPIFAMQFRRLRKENKIFLSAFIEKTPTTESLKADDKKEYRELKFAKNILEGKDYALYITEDKVIFVRTNEKDQIGIKIQDPSFAELQRTLFNKLWEKAN